MVERDYKNWRNCWRDSVVNSSGDILKLETGYGNEVATITVDGLTVNRDTSVGIELHLGAGISGITLTGTAPINVTDSAGANTIVGNDGQRFHGL